MTSLLLLSTIFNVVFIASQSEKQCASESSFIEASPPQSQLVIPVRCGSVEGSLLLDKFGQLGKPENNSKCIYYRSKDKWVTPIEFESLGGKAKSCKWKQSIKTNNNVSVDTILSTSGLQAAKTSKTHLTTPLSQSESSPLSKTLASSPSQTPLNVLDISALGSSTLSPILSSLTNPLLAFIKAYRLRGDVSGLRNVVLSTTDSVRLAEAYKSLWQSCKSDIEELSLSLMNHRDSDKCSMSDAIDEFSEHLIGKKVSVSNAIRLGRRKLPDSESAPPRPRPLLITLYSDWDQRLLLSKCRHLKNFSTHKKVFLRADLPPDYPQKIGVTPPIHPCSHSLMGILIIVVLRILTISLQTPMLFTCS